MVPLILIGPRNVHLFCSAAERHDADPHGDECYSMRAGGDVSVCHGVCVHGDDDRSSTQNLVQAPLRTLYNTKALVGRRVKETKKMDTEEIDKHMTTPKRATRSEPPSTERTQKYSADRMARVWRGGQRRIRTVCDGAGPI